LQICFKLQCPQPVTRNDPGVKTTTITVSAAVDAILNVLGPGPVVSRSVSVCALHCHSRRWARLQSVAKQVYHQVRRRGRWRLHVLHVLRSEHLAELTLSVGVRVLTELSVCVQAWQYCI